MRSQRQQIILRQWLAIGYGAVFFYVFDGSHTHNDRRDGRVRQAESKGRLRQALYTIMDEELQTPHMLHHFLFAIYTKIIVAPISGWKGCVFIDSPRKRSLIQGNSGNDAYMIFLAVGKEPLFRCLLKDIVDYLEAVYKARFGGC